MIQLPADCSRRMEIADHTACQKCWNSNPQLKSICGDREDCIDLFCRPLNTAPPSFSCADYDQQAGEIRALIDALDDNGILAVIRNVAVSAPCNPDEKTAQSLWHHLKAHQPRLCQYCGQRPCVDGEYSCGYWDCVEQSREVAV